jgi:asparagine N-glycosylation enzyme membrane subunit Stt3
VCLELYGKTSIALASALLAGLIPAYLNRTLCYWYRYEILAVPILFMSFLFFLRLFSAPSRRSIVANGAITTTLLVAALYVWRLSVLFVIAYAVCLLYVSLRSSRNLGRVLVVGLFLLCLYGILLQFVPGFGMRNQGFNYGSFPRAVVEIALRRMGASVPFSDFTRLVFDNQELQEVGLGEMFGWLNLSLSAGFIVMFVVLYLSSRERSAQRDIVFAFLLVFSALSLLVLRNVVMLAPLVAIVAGDCVRVALSTQRRREIRMAVLAIVLVISAKTAWDAYKMASYRHPDTRPGLYLSEALIKIRTLTPSTSVVSSYWADGYPIQTYSHRPTLTDGLFESREIVSRILEESKAYYSQDEEDLWNYCTRFGATYLLLPTRRTESYAHQAGVPYDSYFTSEGPTTLGTRTVLARLLHDPADSKRFREIFRNKGYVLYEILRG